MFYVYVYRTPCNVSISTKISILAGQPFYIGKGKGNRWKSHLKLEASCNVLKAKGANFLRNEVIKQIREKGFEPIIEFFLKDVESSGACETEILLISKYGRITSRTGPLTNITEGGEGSGKGPKHSEEQKQKWSRERKGIAPANKGVKRPGIGGRKKGSKWSKEERDQKMKARSAPGYYAYLSDPDRCKKVSEGLKGRVGSARGKKWFNDGLIQTYAKECPAGFKLGRLYRALPEKKGMVWFNDGKVNRQFRTGEELEGFKRGRINKK